MRILPISLAFAVIVAAFAGTAITELFETVHAAFETISVAFPTR